MKKRGCFILFYFFNLIALSSQVDFENGYFITNDEVKTTCLIKNFDWRNNPTSFKYLLSEGGQILKAEIGDIIEFGIGNHTKFERQEVEIDRSSQNLADLTSDKQPHHEVETLFLKVLVEGKATLYAYISGSLMKFFYSIDNSTVKPLVRKLYRTRNDLKENARYKQDLLNSMKCHKVGKTDFTRMAYEVKSLVALFNKYNLCTTESTIDYTKKHTKGYLRFSPVIGINSSSLKSIRYNSLRYDFGAKLYPSFGLEIEYVLPFLKNKFSVVAQPQYFNSLFEVEDRATGIVRVKFSHIDLPVGLRYGFFITKNHKVFTSAYFVNSIPINASFLKLNISVQPNVALGLGIKLWNKLSFEYRYNTVRDITQFLIFQTTDYRNQGLYLSYSLN